MALRLGAMGKFLMPQPELNLLSFTLVHGRKNGIFRHYPYHPMV